MLIIQVYNKYYISELKPEPDSYISSSAVA